MNDDWDELPDITNTDRRGEERRTKQVQRVPESRGADRRVAVTRAKMLFSDEWLRRKIATGSDDEPAAGNPNGDLLGRERKHRGDGWWCASTTCPDLPGVIPCVLWLADIAPAICKATKRDSERRKEDRGVSAHWNLPDRRLAQLDRRQP